MVGKLIKFELKALFRVILYVGIGAIVVALIGRIILAADGESLTGQLFSALAIVTAACGLFMAFTTSVAQFSVSFFTGEGYMTFSLPATPVQLIFSKLAAAIVATFYGIAVAAICMMIYLSGIGESALKALSMMVKEYGNFFWLYVSSDPLFGVEFALRLIASVPMGLLFFYLIVCVGQLFTRWRKGMTFAIAVAALLLVSILNAYGVEPVLELCTEKVSGHLAAWVQIALYYGLDVGMFFLIRYILMHRVNFIL